MSGLEEQDKIGFINMAQNRGVASPKYYPYLYCPICNASNYSWRVITNISNDFFFNVTDAFYGPNYYIRNNKIEDVIGFKCHNCRTIFGTGSEFYDRTIALMEESDNIWKSWYDRL